jgi:phosphoglycolate phosphatase-like HAD superfamily hydrolase
VALFPSEDPLRSRSIVFDIDGTLVSAGGVSSRALAESLALVFGTAGDGASYDYSGKTDPQIIRDLMREAGFSDAVIDARMRPCSRTTAIAWPGACVPSTW